MEHLPVPDLMRILLAFENGESAFKDFLPLCDPSVQQLGKYLLRQPECLDLPASKKAIYKAIYKKDYDKTIMRELVKSMHSLLLVFIGHLQSNNTALGQRQKAQTLRKNGFFDAIAAANDRALELSAKEVDGVRHFVETEVYREKYFKDGDKTDLLRSKEAATDFNLVGHLKFVINDLVLCRIRDEIIPKNLQDEVRHLFSLLKKPGTPLISVQVAAVKYFLNPSKETYYTFKKAYFDSFDVLRYGKDFLLIYLVDAVMCFPKADEAHEEIKQEYSTLYLFGIENDLLLEDGEISILRFNNIIYAGQILSDFMLIELAKTSLVQHICPKNKRRCESMADVYLSFGKGEYDKTSKNIGILNKDTRLPFYMVLRKQVMGFKCAYERSTDKQHAAVYLDEKEQIFRNRLNEYVDVKKIKEIRRDRHFNFLEFLNLLARRKTTSITKTVLEKKLDTYKGVIVELIWLKEKIAELET